MDIEPGDDYAESIFEKIKYWYWSKIDYNWRPFQIWYRLKCKFWKKYNTIKCQYWPTTWIDRDELLFHCNFQILCDFIEKECLPEIKIAQPELQELYYWYKKCSSDHLNRRFFDIEYNEYYNILKKLMKEQELGPIKFVPYMKNEKGKVTSYKMEHPIKDEKKYSEYVKAIIILEKMHEEFLNRQTKKLIDFRQFLWT